MRPLRSGIAVLAALASAASAATASSWAGELQAVFAPEVRYAEVSGDTDKFQSRWWTNSGFDAGLRSFEMKNEDVVDGWSMESEGRILPGNYDHLYDLLLRKEDVGFLRLDFKQFRKYYGSEGGTYRYFVPLKTVDSGRDLYLDIGKFGIGLGLTPPHLPDVWLGYEHEYKTGTKSRLTWASVQEGTTSKKTAPSWQDIDEEVHLFEVTLNDVFYGTAWKVEQSWEHVTSRNLREEINVSTNSTASQNKVRDQLQEPKADRIQSVVELERWIVKDKVFTSAGYRYGQIENEEIENIFEMNRDHGLQSFTNPEQVRDAVATNSLRTHTGVASGRWVVSEDMNATLKLKAEDVARESMSSYPKDTTLGTPDGRIDQTSFSNVTDDAYRFGEGLSLRYSGIERTALYSEWEFEQTRSNLIEDRQDGASAGERFNRHTLTRSSRGGAALGTHFYPCEFFTLTGQVRHRSDIVDYDDQSESNPAATSAKSAFVDGELVRTDEATARAKFDLWGWFRPVLRYVFRDQNYSTHFEGNPLDLAADVVSHTYAVDLPVEITPALSASVSYSLQNAWTRTMAAEATALTYPQLDSDVSTTTVTADYALSDTVSLTGLASYQTAANYNDFANISVPYGTDYEETHATVGVRFKVREGLTVEPKYGFYWYNPNEDVEDAKYDAHVVWVGVHWNWA